MNTAGLPAVEKIRRAHLVCHRIADRPPGFFVHVAIALELRDGTFELIEMSEDKLTHKPLESLDGWRRVCRTRKVAPILKRIDELDPDADYDLLRNNCEHAALYAFFGVRVSVQVMTAAALFSLAARFAFPRVYTVVRHAARFRV